MRVKNASGTVSRYELEDRINEEVKYLEDLGYDVHIAAMILKDELDVVDYSIWFEVL